MFLVILNNIYIFLVPVIILLSGGVSDYPKFAMSALFYLIFSVAITAPFLKLMYVSQKGRQIADGIERMDRAFAHGAPPRRRRGHVRRRALISPLKTSASPTESRRRSTT